jgi:hypothetical protein
MLLAGLLAGLTGGACRAHAPREEWSEPAEPEPAAAPAWVGMPLSWEKLEAIETWLMGVGPDRAPEYVTRAELELAEGRLAFARGDERTSGADVKARLASAETGFRRVLSRVGASALERQRAKQGLEEAQRLSGKLPAASARVGEVAVLPRSAWGAGHVIPARLTRQSGPYKRITVHHSVVEAEPGVSGTRDALQKIQKVQMRDEGFGDIGYHYLIDAQGRVYAGRSLDFQGAHAMGQNNVDNIGICLIGNFLHVRPSAPALKALSDLTDELLREHSIPRSRVYGHLELKATDCPGRLMDWVHRYRAPAATH